MTLQKRTHLNKITIILLVVLIVVFSCLSPLKTFCELDSSTKLSEQLNNSVIEELGHIDFSAFNEVIVDLDAKNTNIFSIDNR